MCVTLLKWTKKNGFSAVFPASRLAGIGSRWAGYSAAEALYLLFLWYLDVSVSGHASVDELVLGVGCRVVAGQEI
jgi:hypothetical protein